MRIELGRALYPIITIMVIACALILLFKDEIKMNHALSVGAKYIGALVVLICIWVIYAQFFYAGGYNPTPKKSAEKMVEFAEIKKTDSVCDLGCGDGNLLALSSPLCRIVTGVEIDPIRHFISKINTSNMPNVKVVKGDLFNYNLKGTDVVFLFLLPDAIKRLQKKLKNELKKGARIVSYEFPLSFQEWKSDKELKVYAYKV